MANSGEFRYPIQILQLIESENEYGETREDYVVERSTRAKLLFTGGSRTEINQEIQLPVTYEIVVRHYCNILDTTRIMFEGKQYRVIEHHHDLENRDIRVKIALINE